MQPAGKYPFQIKGEARAKSTPPTLTESLRHLFGRLRRIFGGTLPAAERRPLYVPTPSSGRIPQVIGRWKVIDVLGAGTSATVFRVVPAWAPASADHYALKLHDRAQAGDRDARDRFRREIRILHSLRHRNVVTLLETGVFQGRMFIVMELVEGRNLRQAIERHRPQLTGKLDWAIQIARALSAMHDKGIVHRDLKPENILTTRVGVIKLADFGLARNHESAPVTQVGCLVGTPAYMAPEYLLGRDPDSRSDLYSFGVILYELFTGAMPFNAVTLNDYIEAHLEAAPIPPRVRTPSLPVAVEGIILKLLEKKPDRRYQTASEIRHALEAVLAQVVGVADPVRWHVA